MKLFRFIAALCFILFYAADASAQIRIIPKEKLEVVASPRLSSDSSALDFDRRHIAAEPMSEDDSPVTFRYSMRNVSDRNIEITALNTTCSCVTAFCEQKVLLPGRTADIVVRYDPEGHPGKFERRIFVYTSGNDEDPAAVLSLAVQVETGADLSGEWPVQKGGIRMRRDKVSFLHGRKAVEKVRFINLTGRPLRLECEEHFLPSAISFRTEPDVVGEGQVGQMVISYDPTKDVKESARIILKGLGVPPSQSSINIEIKK